MLETDFASAERSSDQEIQAQHQLFRDHPLLSKVLDGMPNMVAILNQNRQAVVANHALVDALGNGDLDKVLGNRPGEVANCPHSQENGLGCGTTKSCRTCGAVAAILAAQAGQTVSRECSIKPEGSLEALDLRVKATPLEIDGQLFTIFAIQDIAHENQVKLLERAFFHDIINSAGGVQGLANLLDDAEDMDEVQEYAPLMAMQSELLVSAIEAQRDMMAAERGNLQVTVQPLGCLPAIQATIDLYRNHEVAQGKTIERDPGSTNVVLTTGKVLLQRTLGNMLKNGLEASAPGEVVTIGCKDLSGKIRFWVRNPAIMPESVKLQIFNRSFSTKGSGRGIGTYSMKLLGESYLGGEVGFSSVEGEGTTFWIELPLRPENDTD